MLPFHVAASAKRDQEGQSARSRVEKFSERPLIQPLTNNESGVYARARDFGKVERTFEQITTTSRRYFSAGDARRVSVVTVNGILNEYGKDLFKFKRARKQGRIIILVLHNGLIQWFLTFLKSGNTFDYMKNLRNTKINDLKNKQNIEINRVEMNIF